MADQKLLRKHLRRFEAFEGVNVLYPSQLDQLAHVVEEARNELGDIVPSYRLLSTTTSDNAKLFLKSALASLRDELSEAQPAAGDSALAALRFDFMRDAALRAFAEQAHAELVAAFANGAIVSTFVLSGSILETVLLDRAGAGAKKRVTLAGLIRATQLDQRVEPLRQLADMIRNSRNSIHPEVARDRQVDRAQARVVAGLLATVVPAIADLP